MNQREKIIYDKRMRIYRVENTQDLSSALSESRALDRIPLFIRSPNNPMTRDDVASLYARLMHLPSETVQEINLRRVFSETVGNPIKKQEVREKLNQMVRSSILSSQLMLLNFDDYEYPDHVLEHFNQTNK